jgi:hypothetical protein
VIPADRGGFGKPLVNCGQTGSFEAIFKIIEWMRVWQSLRPPQKTLGINRRHLPGPQTNHGENTRLWTGYQRRLLGDGFVADDPHMAKLPKLSEDDLTQIKTIKGRAGELSREERIDFNRVAFPEVDCSGPYSRVTAVLFKAMFGGDAEFNDTIFGRDAIFYSTKFTQDAWFFNATFCEAA